MEIKFFDSSIEKFIESLEPGTVAKVLRSIDLLEEFGWKLDMPHSKKISKNLFELRTRGVGEVRIFYTFRKTSTILLHGFSKKSQKTPQKEIRTATKKLLALDTI